MPKLLLGSPTCSSKGSSLGSTLTSTSCDGPTNCTGGTGCSAGRRGISNSSSTSQAAVAAAVPSQDIDLQSCSHHGCCPSKNRLLLVLASPTTCTGTCFQLQPWQNDQKEEMTRSSIEQMVAAMATPVVATTMLWWVLVQHLQLHCRSFHRQG
jgi:hypothetical protein